MKMKLRGDYRKVQAHSEAPFVVYSSDHTCVFRSDPFDGLLCSYVDFKIPFALAVISKYTICRGL